MYGGQVYWSPHPRPCIWEGSGGSAATQESHGEDLGGPEGCFLSPCSQALVLAMGLALARPAAQSSPCPFPQGGLLSAILRLSLCAEAEGLAAGQLGLVFLSRLQAAVCARRRRWHSLPSLLGSAACGQAAGRGCRQPPACGAASLGQRSTEVLKSGSGGGHGVSRVMSPKGSRSWATTATRCWTNGGGQWDGSRQRGKGEKGMAVSRIVLAQPASW